VWKALFHSPSCTCTAARLHDGLQQVERTHAALKNPRETSLVLLPIVNKCRWLSINFILS
jgi:hypothetical protein